MSATSGDDAGWAALAVGDALSVVKLAPDGSEVARYPGAVVARVEPGSWVVVRAVWTYRHIDVAGLSFTPGDVLLEWFSPRHGFNAFAVHDADGDFRGWYANVTYPPRLIPASTPPTLVWRDLYLDIVALPDGSRTVCDADELAASELETRDPRLYTSVLKARDEMLHRLERRAVPFVAGPVLAP